MGLTVSGIEALSQEIWEMILFEAAEPKAASTCSLFRDIYKGERFIFRTISPSLGERGIRLLGSESIDKKMTKAKTIMLTLLRSNKLYTEANRFEKSPLNLGSFLRAFFEERAANLERVFSKICEAHPVFEGKLISSNEEHPNAPLLVRAEKIRLLLSEMRDQVEKITELDLKSLDLTLIPKELALFKRLQKIDLSGNKISHLSHDFGKTWNSIEECNLDYNQLTELPKKFGGNWREMKRISLNSNQIEAFLPSFGDEWENLEKIDLNFNKHASLPDQFGSQWKLITKITLFSEHLTGLPNDFCSSWKNLQFIQIKNGKISQEILERIVVSLPKLILLT